MLDTFAEPEFDALTRVAAALFDVPIALLSLVEECRQWFKSKQGLEAPETSRRVSFCAHAVASEQPLVVEDASQDSRFFDNPLVLEEPKIRFYAGVPVR